MCVCEKGGRGAGHAGIQELQRGAGNRQALAQRQAVLTQRLPNALSSRAPTLRRSLMSWYTTWAGAPTTGSLQEKDKAPRLPVQGTAVQQGPRRRAAQVPGSSPRRCSADAAACRRARCSKRGRCPAGAGLAPSRSLAQGCRGVARGKGRVQQVCGQGSRTEGTQVSGRTWAGLSNPGKCSVVGRPLDARRVGLGIAAACACTPWPHCMGGSWAVPAGAGLTVHPHIWVCHFRAAQAGPGGRRGCVSGAARDARRGQKEALIPFAMPRCTLGTWASAQTPSAQARCEGAVSALATASERGTRVGGPKAPQPKRAANPAQRAYV